MNRNNKWFDSTDWEQQYTQYSNRYISMKSAAFSNKDAHIIQQLYKQVIQNYYENPSPERTSQILTLNDLIMQSMSQQQNLNYQQIVAKLQVLKIKAKNSQQLRASIGRCVEHLKRPKKVVLQQQTLQQCLRYQQLYPFCCTVISRLYRQKIKNSQKNININKLIKCIVEANRFSFNGAIQVLTQIVSVDESAIKKQSKIDQFAIQILDKHMDEVIKQKLALSRCLKIVMVAAKLQKTLIFKKQDKLSLGIYNQSGSILQIQQILQICYHDQYCFQIRNSPINIKELDLFYVWSYCSSFCIQLKQSHVDKLQELLQNQRVNKQKMNEETEFKIYTTLNNIINVSNFRINYTWKLPTNVQKNLYSYLLLIYTVLQHDHNDISQYFDAATLQKICNQNKNICQNAKKLFRRIKSLGIPHSPHPNKKHSLISRQQSESSIISPQQQPQFLLPKAMKIPKNDADLQSTHRILILGSSIQDQQLHKDNIRSLKNRALDSLRVSLIENQFTSLQKIFNNLNIDEYDPITLKRLIQMANMYLKINPSSVASFNLQNLAKVIIKCHQTNHEYLNFDQIGQIFYLCLGHEQWNKEKYLDKNDKQWKDHIIQKLKNMQIAKIQKPPQSLQNVLEIINRLSMGQKNQQIVNLSFLQQKKQQQQNIQLNGHKFNKNEIENVNNEKKQQIEIQDATINENKVEGNVHTMTELTKQQIVIKNLILKFKIQDMLKRWKKKSKKSKQRFYKLREWAETENAYMEKLLVLRDQVRNPLLQNNIINELQAMQIFCNLDAMIQLCEEMRNKIKQLVDNFNYVHTELAPSLKVVTNYLKIYKQYSLNYSKSYQTMKGLAQEQGYSDIVKVVGLQNYLFSPVQRFQKYHLFVSDYMKVLSKQHKDYTPLEKGHSLLLKVTDQINQFIEAQNKSKKMLQLQKLFGNIVTSSRHYKNEFSANCFDFKCKVFLFNDLMLVTKVISDTKLQIYMRLQLCGNSFIVKQPNCKSFQNRIYVGGTDTSVHLTFNNQGEQQYAYKLINATIESLYQNQFMRLDLISQSKLRMVKVLRNLIKNQQQWKQQTYYKLKIKPQVVAIQKRAYAEKQKTFFVVKVELPKPDQISQLLFCEVQLLYKLQQHLKQLYKNIKIPSSYLVSRASTSDDLTKMTEHWCILIESFLNFILKNQQISKKPQLILHRLNFHQSIWNYLNVCNVASQCMCQACLHAQIFTGIDFYYKQKQLIKSKKYMFCIINSFRTQNTIRSLVEQKMFEQFSIQSKLVWANCQLKRIDYSLQNKTWFGKQINVKIYVKLLSQQICIKSEKSTIYTNARQVIQQICKKLGIQTTLDLALVLVQDDHQTFLDDDQLIEPIVKIIQQAENEQQKALMNARNSERSSLFSRFSWGNSFVPAKKRKRMALHLRKLYFFHPSLQETACQNNPERYQFLTGQLLRKFQNQSLTLNPDDIRVLCALVYCIQHFSFLIIQKKLNVEQQKLKRYLPESKWNLINAQFIQKVAHIIQNQMELANKISLIYRCLLKQFGQKFGWHCQYFPVLNTQSSLLLGNFTKLNIGISYKKISITREKTSVELLSYPISDFKYHIYGESLFIETEQKTHRFIGTNLIVLDKLIQTYRLIYNFQHQIS